MYCCPNCGRCRGHHPRCRRRESVAAAQRRSLRVRTTTAAVEEAKAACREEHLKSLREPPARRLWWQRPARSGESLFQRIERLRRQWTPGKQPRESVKG